MYLELRDFNITEADWVLDGNVLSSIRKLVFIIEQRVPQDEEWDGRDDGAWHWVATDPGDRPIGTAAFYLMARLGVWPCSSSIAVEVSDSRCLKPPFRKLGLSA